MTYTLPSHLNQITYVPNILYEHSRLHGVNFEQKTSNSIWLSVLLYPKEVWNERDVSFYHNSTFKFDSCLVTQTVTEAWPITSPTSSLHITNTVTCTENTTCKYELSFTTWTRHTAGPAWKTQRAEIPLQKTSITSQGTVIYHTALHYNIYTIPYILHYPTLFYCNVLYCTMQIPYCTMRRQSFGTKTRTGLDNREIGVW